MKRVGYLIDRIADVDNLLQAYYQARRGKHDKYGVKEYGKNLTDNILCLRRQILSTEVDVGKYHYFKIYDPKERQICAAPFSERVLHHAIINVCKPYFERHLIYDTYATRDGKGVYAAIDRARVAMKKYRYVAKLDVRKYFDSISHTVLKTKLRRLFKDPYLLTILEKIIDTYHVEPGRGIPIGNLTSQYFANYYLSSVDHSMKENLSVPVYIRYMDDILLFADRREDIYRYVEEIELIMHRTVLLNLKPAVVQQTQYGISFLGYMLYPHKILLNRRSKIRFRKKLQMYEQYRQSGRWSEVQYLQHITPLLSFAQKAFTHGMRNDICNRYCNSR
ncbi:MAG: RNA-directed DNA polymerase [Bacteroidaceae bacterium]|nr:RNA-directed DNA polymerase [Bacteroidaceae bacterium]